MIIMVVVSFKLLRAKVYRYIQFKYMFTSGFLTFNLLMLAYGVYIIFKLPPSSDNTNSQEYEFDFNSIERVTPTISLL